MVTLRRLRALLRADGGSTLVEATIVFPMLLILTFGLLEFGYALWQYGAAEKATAVGARYLATRGPLAPGVADCFVATTAAAGTPCSQIPEAAAALAWSTTISSPSCPATSTAVFCQMFARMRDIAPSLTPSQVRVDLRGSGIGFVGRGTPVPLITVRTTGLTYNFVALDELPGLTGLQSISMPGFDATSVGEDQREGPPS
jgi:Flp pilus assembly protein TadG